MAGDINLGLVSVQMIFKAIRLKEIPGNEYAWRQRRKWRTEPYRASTFRCRRGQKSLQKRQKSNSRQSKRKTKRKEHAVPEEKFKKFRPSSFPTRIATVASLDPVLPFINFSELSET